MKPRKELLEIKCPIGITQNVMAGKWKLVIIWLLKDGVKRFSELQRALPDIRQGYLTQQLRELERDGLIHREVYKVVPPKVEYSLTDIGKKFLEVMDIMYKWGEEYMKYIKFIEK
ncbi:HxlR family transcriptional regulator [Thermincola ferriacetica]|uniref:HxlR family transcriptional regulator n=1 Tax=Thermincola ferriacetica TaxID=281456 RepID=A0A0L6W341_9FIRM|nr:HxlR family transcriptional regulator [Thermincola ferriacetica]